MNEFNNIDELLNAYVDDELTQRQQNEVQRLIGHDKRVARRVRVLEKCKQLVGSLPSVEAPEGLVEDVKNALVRRTLLSNQPHARSDKLGARHLLFRKVATVAAVLVLVGALAVVILSIVMPQSDSAKPVITRNTPAPGLIIQGSGPDVAVKTDTTILNGRLELATQDFAAVDSIIRKAIKDNGLVKLGVPLNDMSQGIYAVSCSRSAMEMLLDDLQGHWQKFDSASLSIESQDSDNRIVVDNVTADQIRQVVDQDSLDRRIEVAKEISALNDIAQRKPAGEVFTALEIKSPQITIPKPVLTHDTASVVKVDPKAPRVINLTITLVDLKN